MNLHIKRFCFAVLLFLSGLSSTSSFAGNGGITLRSEQPSDDTLVLHSDDLAPPPSRTSHHSASNTTDTQVSYPPEAFELLREIDLLSREESALSLKNSQSIFLPFSEIEINLLPYAYGKALHIVDLRSQQSWLIPTEEDELKEYAPHLLPLIQDLEKR